MKVLNAVYGDATGGRWQAMLNIADTLESYGHEVVLLRGEENKHLSSGKRPIYVIPNTGFYSINAALKVRKFLQEQQFDVIIAHSGKAVWLFKNAMLGMKNKIPVIAVNHSHNVKRTLRADAFIHITPYVQELVQKRQTPEERAVKPQQVISNLIYLPNEVAEPQYFKKPPTIVMFTRMMPTKGVDILIRAISLLNQRGIDVEVILAGDGENKKEYQQLVIDLKIEHIVTFPGWVNGEQKTQLYHQADIIAVPSITDIQPLGIIDAFGWGKLVLSSDHIGPLQICKHKHNAWVSKVGDPKSIADGIEYLIQHPDEAFEMATQAKKEAVEKYCFEQIAKAHNQFVEHVVAYYRAHR